MRDILTTCSAHWRIYNFAKTFWWWYPNIFIVIRWRVFVASINIFQIPEIAIICNWWNLIVILTGLDESLPPRQLINDGDHVSPFCLVHVSFNFINHYCWALGVAPLARHHLAPFMSAWRWSWNVIHFQWQIVPSTNWKCSRKSYFSCIVIRRRWKVVFIVSNVCLVVPIRTTYFDSARSRHLHHTSDIYRTRRLL